MKKWLSIGMAALLVLSLLAGCAGGGEEQDLETPRLRVAAVGRQSSADPVVLASSGGETLAVHLYENLMKRVDDGTGHAKVVEGIASSVAVENGADGSQTYTFTLRSNALWSDGEPVTAQDFVYAWQRLFSLESYPAGLSNLSLVEGYSAARAAHDGTLLTGVTAQDDSTLVIRLTGPCAYFLDVVCADVLTMPVRQKSAEGGWSAGSVLTNGPYTLTSLDGEGALLTRSESYYDGAQGPGELWFSWSGTEEDLEAGELDFVAPLSEESMGALKEAGELTVEAVTSTYALVLNNAAAPFDSLEVRQAFAMVIDNEDLLAAAGTAADTAATGLVPSGITNRDDLWQTETEPSEETAADGEQPEETAYWDYRAVGDAKAGEPEESSREARAAAAQALLSQAGYPGGSGFPEVEYLYVDTEQNAAVAAYLQSLWQESLGVRVTVRALSEEEVRTALLAGEYTMASFLFAAPYDDATAFLSRWTSSTTPGQGNVVSYSDRAYDLLLTVVDEATSASAREACLHDAEALLLQSCAVVPLFYPGTASRLAEGLTGVYRSAMGIYYFSSVTYAQ